VRADRRRGVLCEGRGFVLARGQVPGRATRRGTAGQVGVVVDHPALYPGRSGEGALLDDVRELG